MLTQLICKQKKVKHVLVVYHYVRECNKTKRLRYEHLKGVLQPADMFTKPLPFVTIARHMKTLGFGGIQILFVIAIRGNLVQLSRFPYLQPIKISQRGNTRKIGPTRLFDDDICSDYAYNTYVLDATSLR